MSYYKLESHDISIKFGRCAQAVNKATLAYKQKGYNSPTTTASSLVSFPGDKLAGDF